MNSSARQGSPTSTLRRTVVAVIVGSFGTAALLGIIVLLGFELGETALRVIMTTAIVGTSSVGVLCCASLLGRPTQSVGMVGMGVTVLTAVVGITMVWEIPPVSRNEFEVVVSGVSTSATFAVASLLLLLTDRRRPAVHLGLRATLGLLVLQLMLTLGLLWFEDVIWDGYPRLFGVVAILAALGVVVVPVLALLLPDTGARGTLPPVLAEQLALEAERRGISVEELVMPLLAGADAPASGSPAD